MSGAGGLGVILTPEDLARIERHTRVVTSDSRGNPIFAGYDEHSSYPITIDLPLCGVCGEIAVRCSHPGMLALQPGEPFKGAK